ncbi:MAG: 50S ribosomal protein L23 [Rickettsiales bacterium]|nr:50S ribosomal protein L23 [Rickettsiales bacterium]
MVNNIKNLDIIKRPLVTEKITTLSQFNKVGFVVAKDATKPEVKQAIEDIYGVKVKAVNIINVAGKQRVFRGRAGKKQDFKKAIITLEAGNQIDITAGVK